MREISLLSEVIHQLQLQNSSADEIEKSTMLSAKVLEESYDWQKSDLTNQLFGICESLEKLYKWFTQSDLQQMEDRKDLFDALNNLKKGPTTPPELPQEYFDRLKEAMQPQDTIGNWLWTVGKFTFGVGVLSGVFKELYGAVRAVTRVFSEEGLLGKLFTKVRSIFSEEGVIGKMLSRIRGLFTEDAFLGKMISRFRGIFSETGFFAKIFSKFENVIGFLKPFFTFGETLGKLLGKIAIPLTVITALFEGVIDAISGYSKDGWLGAVKAGIPGALNGLVGWLWDTLRDVLAWISEKTGLDSLSEWIKEIPDFKQIWKDMMDMFTSEDGVIGWLTELKDSIAVIIKDMWDKSLDMLKSSLNSAWEKIGNFAIDADQMLRKLLKSILPKYDASAGWYSPNNAAVTLLQSAGLYDFANAPAPDIKKTLDVSGVSAPDIKKTVNDYNNAISNSSNQFNSVNISAPSDQRVISHSSAIVAPSGIATMGGRTFVPNRLPVR